MILNSFALEDEPSTTGASAPANPLTAIWLGLLLIVSLTSRLVISVGARAGGTRGTLKKPKTSRYSNSFGAKFRDGIAAVVDVVDGGKLLVLVGEERGCREMRKSRSKAHRRISASIFTVDGVVRSCSVSPDCWYSPYSSRTRWRIVLYRSATFQCVPIWARVSTKKMKSGFTVWAMVDPWTSNRRAETQRVKANGGPSLSSSLLFTTKRVTERMLSTASRHRWLAL